MVAINQTISIITLNMKFLMYKLKDFQREFFLKTQQYVVFKKYTLNLKTQID